MVATSRALTPIFGRNNRPTRQAVRAIVDKFETTFTLLDVPVPKRRRIASSEEIIAAVSASIQNEPNQSIPRRSQELGIAQTTLWRIMRKDLGLHAFKIKLTQKLKPLDHLKCRNFSNCALAKLEENKEFHRKIIFSDETHFWLNGFVNKQNMRYWLATNPSVLLETPLHPQKVTGAVFKPEVSMESAIVLCWKIICGQNWMNLTSMICGFNMTVSLASTRHDRFIERQIR